MDTRAYRHELSPQRFAEISRQIQDPGLTLSQRAALRLKLFLEEEEIIRVEGERIPAYHSVFSRHLCSRRTGSAAGRPLRARTGTRMQHFFRLAGRAHRRIASPARQRQRGHGSVH